MIEFFEQPSVIAAIITVVGAALVKKFYFDVQNRLRIEVRAWNYKTSEAAKKIWLEAFDAKRDYHSTMRRVLDVGGYMMVTITNIGKKKILGVSVMMLDSNMSMFLQIDDADEIIEVTKAQLVGVGDIQPKHSRVLHIWTSADVSDFNFDPIKGLLRISADELDSVRLRFPMPRYLRTKIEPWLVGLLCVLVIALFFIGLYSGFLHD